MERLKFSVLSSYQILVWGHICPEEDRLFFFLICTKMTYELAVTRHPETAVYVEKLGIWLRLLKAGATSGIWAVLIHSAEHREPVGSPPVCTYPYVHMQADQHVYCTCHCPSHKSTNWC